MFFKLPSIEKLMPIEPPIRVTKNKYLLRILKIPPVERLGKRFTGTIDRTYVLNSTNVRSYCQPLFLVCLLGVNEMSTCLPPAGNYSHGTTGQSRARGGQIGSLNPGNFENGHGWALHGAL